MDNIENQLRILAKMFPNDMAFGSEVRKLVFQMRKEDHEKRKEEWDKLKTTDDFLRVMDKREKQKNENN